MIQVSGYISSYYLHLPVDIQTDSGEGTVKLGSQRGLFSMHAFDALCLFNTFHLVGAMVSQYISYVQILLLVDILHNGLVCGNSITWN